MIGLTAAPLGLIAGLNGMLQRQRAAYFLTPAWTVFLIGVSCFWLALLGVLEATPLTMNLMHLGAMLETILLSLALADRINTARSEAEAARRQAVVNLRAYRSVFENAIEGLFRAAPDGQLLRANAALAQMAGAASGKALVERGMRLGDLFPSPEQYAQLQLALATGPVTGFEVHSLVGGKERILTLSCRWVGREAGEQRALEGSVVDVTAQRQQEEAERAQQASLAEAKARDAFLANMSHEMRTPLNAIQGFAEIALASPLTPEQTTYMENIRSASRHLLGVINDILDLSRLQEGVFQLEPVDFSLLDLLEETALLFAHDRSKPRVAVVLGCAPGVPERLRGDALRLRQVLANLLGNALKFTDQGEVELRVELQRIDDGRVQLLFSVRDTGIGIDPAQQSRLFQAFAQAGAARRRGSGLGLSICKHLVEMMEGQVWVESSPGLGSIFSASVRLPIVSQAPAWHGQALAGVRVGIISESALVRRFLAESLPQFGARLVVCASAADLTDVDVLLLDAETSGPPPQPHPPLVVLGDDGALASQNVRLGKPLNPLALLKQLELARGRGASAAAPPREPPRRLAGARVLIVEDVRINRELLERMLSMAGHPCPLGR